LLQIIYVIGRKMKNTMDKMAKFPYVWVTNLKKNNGAKRRKWTYRTYVRRM